MPLHEKHRKWVELRGIDPDLAERFGMETVRDEQGFWIKAPYFERGQLVNAKFRMATEKRHRMVKGAPLTWWNLNCLESPDCWERLPGDDLPNRNAAPVIITEGEWDALAAISCGYRHVISVPNGAPASASDAVADTEESDAERFRFVWRGKPWTDQVARFIIATDADEPGRILAAELVRRLGAWRCLHIEYPEGCKDLNDVLLREGAAGVTACINAAKPYPVRGLYRMADFPTPPPIRPVRVRIPVLADVEPHGAWPIVPGTFTVIIGYPGSGKTTFITAVVADLMQQGVNVCMGSFETLPRPILEQTMRSHLAGGLCRFASPERLAEADQLIADRLSIIAQHPRDDSDEMNLEQVLDLAATAAFRDGARVLVIDPWNEIEHKRRPDESETDYSGRAIRALKRFAKIYDMAVVVVAHPRKPDLTSGKLKAPSLYEASGSAHWYNKADYGLVIHRPDRTRPELDCHVVKVRMGLPGTEGSYTLTWDRDAHRYSRPFSYEVE